MKCLKIREFCEIATFSEVESVAYIEYYHIEHNPQWYPQDQIYRRGQNFSISKNHQKHITLCVLCPNFLSEDLFYLISREDGWGKAPWTRAWPYLIIINVYNLISNKSSIDYLCTQ